MAKHHDTGLGPRVKQVRKTLRMKQKEFSERLDISVTTLSDIETGKSRPGFDFFVNIYNEFRVNLYHLFFGVGDAFIPPGHEPGLPTRESIISRIQDDDERKMLDYFFRSKMVKYHLLLTFRGFYNEKRREIELDVEETKKT